MTLRRILAFAVIFVLPGTVGYGERRTEKGSFQMSFTNVVVGQCDRFDILTDWVGLFTWVDRFDKDGQFVQEVLHVRVLGESLYYNSMNSEKAVAGGPGELENSRWDAATGRVYASGLPWKVRVPGHGLIWAETGALVFQCDPNTFENCEVVSNVGHNQFVDGDLAALCDYLK